LYPETGDKFTKPNLPPGFVYVKKAPRIHNIDLVFLIAQITQHTDLLKNNKGNSVSLKDNFLPFSFGRHLLCIYRKGFVKNKQKIPAFAGGFVGLLLR
jgi:hypothetical protein